MEQLVECNSRNIPLPIQRAVRQRCGFGCVICGIPLYEYEHMSEWAQVKRHVAEEITLLCDQHHREKTGGLLPKSVVEEADKNPFNHQEGVSKPYNLHFSGTDAHIEIGGNTFKSKALEYASTLIPLSVDGTPLIGFVLADGHLLFNLVIFDEFNHPVLHIKNNQLFYSNIPWDIQLVGTTLTVREAHRKILVEIEFKPPNRVVINKGRFLHNGVEVLIKPTHIFITNNSGFISRCTAINCNVGLIIGHHPNPISGIMKIDGVPRYLFDRKQALMHEKKCLANLDK